MELEQEECYVLRNKDVTEQKHDILSHCLIYHDFAFQLIKYHGDGLIYMNTIIFELIDECVSAIYT